MAPQPAAGLQRNDIIALLQAVAVEAERREVSICSSWGAPPWPWRTPRAEQRVRDEALSAREVDEDDLRILFPLCGFQSAGDALDAVASAYPDRLLKPSSQYLVEGTANEFTGSPDAR